jgi:hypothetical protein
MAGLRSRLPAASLWSLGILSYLLFCPHVTATEELQVVIILALCVSPKGRLSRPELVLLITLPLLVFFSPAIEPFSGIRLPLFLIQLVLFFFFAFSGRTAASGGLAWEDKAGAGPRTVAAWPEPRAAECPGGNPTLPHIPIRCGRSAAKKGGGDEKPVKQK